MLLQLIRKWLKKCLGITLSINPSCFYEAAKDGVLLAQVLYHYEVITFDELQVIEETKDPAVAHDNYSNIKDWLQRLDFILTSEDISEIVQGADAAVSLFYELYVKLEKKDSLIEVSKAKGFVVEKVKERSMDAAFFDLNPLCEPLIKNWDVVNWEKGRLDALMAKYVESRKEYNEYLEKKEEELRVHEQKATVEDVLPIPETQRTDFTYDQLIAQQRRVLSMEPFEPNMEEAKRILNQIKQRKKHRLNRTAFRLEMQQQLLADVWKKIGEMEDNDFDTIICKKIMKQSNHEKTVAEKLLSIRKQKHTIIENRKIQDEIDRKRRDEDFIRKLFEDSLEDRLEFHQKRMSAFEEHQRLYANKLKLKALKHEKVCKDVLDDIIDLALRETEFKHFYGVEPDQYTRRDWAALFVKGQPIFDEVLPSDLIQPRGEDFSKELEEIYRREMQRFDIVDTEVFNDYVQFQRMWRIEEGLEDFVTTMELGMNCLGFAVHRVLLKKYPLPVPDKPNLSQEIEISVCTRNVDLAKLEFLQRLLELRGVKVVQLSDARDFCMKAYESELKTEVDEPFPEEEYERELSPRKEKGGKGEKKGKKGKKGKKQKGSSKGSKKNKSSKKSKKKKKDKEDVELVLEHKQAQTPRLFPWEKVIFSNKAKLGRVAKEILGQGQELDDKLLIQMFVEYLQSMPDIKGWVLINYPDSYEQAALLEQALSGKPVPKKYYDKVLNQESLMSVEIHTEEPKSPNGCLSPEKTTSNEELEDTNEGPTIEDQNNMEPDESENNLSEFTILGDWDITPEQRVAELLPDLKDLAYFTEEEKIAIEKKKEAACSCICNSQKINQSVGQPAPANPCVFDLNDSTICRATSEQISCKEVNLNIKSGYDCTCLFDNTFDQARDEEIQAIAPQEEEIVQTNILTVEPQVDDDQVAESVVAGDVYEEVRVSSVVPNPRPLEKEEYNTVLTAYIKLQEKQDDENEDFPLSWSENLERQNGLEKFYFDQGCFYMIEYEEFTSDTVKCLAKTVIGDYTLPLKDSIGIFGERYKEAVLEDGGQKISKKGKEKKKAGAKKKKGHKKETKAKEKKSKSKSSKSSKGKGKSSKSSKGKGKRGKGKKGKKAAEPEKLTYEEKETQAPTVEEVEEEEFVEPRAGEENWEYVTLPLPEKIELSLADFWYNFEQKYKQNFKDMFFNKRILLEQIIPFLAKVRGTMGEFLQRPDQKQYYLREFQKTLNQIGLSLRSDNETKCELLLRIEEFKEKLLGISDRKMMESEEERRDFVRQNWLFWQFCELTNNVSTAFQFEIDRLVDTLQFLSDYYTALITKSTEGYEFHKELLPKHVCKKTSDAFNKLFIDTRSEDDKTEFHHFIENCKKVASEFVESMKPLALKPVTNMKKIFETKTKKKAPRLDEEVKENADKIFEEWECAIHGEFARMTVHLNTITNEALNLFTNVISWIKSTFVEIFDEISARYENEIASVHKACELLMESVEQEVLIRPELTFEAEQLAEIQIDLFPSIVEDDSGGAFTVKQLEEMARIFFDLASSGDVKKMILLLVINDILYQDDEDTETPPLWRNLSTTKLEAVLTTLFDDEEHVYWKDFIVCNLLLPFPTNAELMSVRQQFRQYDTELTELVTREEFDTITLWFENEEAKSLISRMYQTDENSFNYTAMLLDFCKDKDQILGFVKALELSLGKRVCFDETEGNDFVAEIMTDRLLFAQKLEEHDETMQLAKRAVSLLIDKIMGDEPRGVTLEEVEEERSSVSDKIISENKFSFTQIGFEGRDTQTCFFLPLELILIIINAVRCTDGFKEQIVEIYEGCRNEQFNNTVLAHEFLQSEELRDLFATTNKFVAHNPARIVKKILCEESETTEDY